MQRRTFKKLNFGIHQIEYRHSLKAPCSVLQKVSSVSLPFLEGFGLTVEKVPKNGRDGSVSGQIMIKIVRGFGKRAQCDWIVSREPQPNRAFQLRCCGGQFVYADRSLQLRRHPNAHTKKAGLASSQFKRILLACQSLTRSKRLTARCSRLLTPIRLMARNCLALPNCAVSYAKQRNGSGKNKNQRRESHRASSRSSKADKFPSNSRALTTLASVSEMAWTFLPIGLRPAPFLAPPRFETLYTFSLAI